MSNPKEISILSKWLEQKLKEYFVRKANSEHNPEEEPELLVERNQSNGVPIAAAISDFRILDLKIAREEKEADQDDDHDDGNLLDDNNNEKDDASHYPGWSKNNDEQYRQTVSRVFVMYQDGCHSVAKELYLKMYAAQCSMENFYSSFGSNSSFSSYIFSLDEHQIDVYTQVFPVLKEWAAKKDVRVNLALPECFYGSYQTEGIQNDDDDDDDESILLWENDHGDHRHQMVIDGDGDISNRKKATGLKASQEKKHSKSGECSSCRLLILEDIHFHGFKLRNVASSTFLSLLNVKVALESLAEIHAVSWAFTRKMGEISPGKLWPFLKNPLYTKYLKECVLPGFNSMLRMARSHLISLNQESKAEGKQILSSLVNLSCRVHEILENQGGNGRPRTLQCLIHQDARCFSFLFKYSMLADNETSAKRLNRQVMITNWRTASSGSPMIDVAFLLLTALPPKTRQQETKNLLKIYWDSFRTLAQNFGDYSLLKDLGKLSDKQLYEDYLHSLLYTCVLITGNLDSVSSSKDIPASSMEVFLEAIKDLIRAGVLH